MTASTSTGSRRPTCAAPWALSFRTPTCSPAPSWTTSATAAWTPRDEECIAAAKLANADGFIRRLPEGYNTMAHRRRRQPVSQGQRQLLAIARAAVADPPVLILDEATSSIDTRTEMLVQQGMDVLMYGRTTFVIAHRLSTVRNADCIMVLEQGRIIERGSHDELMEKKGTLLPALHRQSASVRRLSHRSSIPCPMGARLFAPVGQGYFFTTLKQ